MSPAVVDHKSVTMMDTELDDYVNWHSNQSHYAFFNFLNAEACDVLKWI